GHQARRARSGSHAAEPRADRGVRGGWPLPVTDRLSRPAEIEPLLGRGAVRIALVVPVGFERDLAAGRAAAMQAIVDGADANTASIAMNYASAIVTAYSARVVLRASQLSPPVVAQARVWYNETLE